MSGRSLMMILVTTIITVSTMVIRPPSPGKPSDCESLTTTNTLDGTVLLDSWDRLEEVAGAESSFCQVDPSSLLLTAGPQEHEVRPREHEVQWSCPWNVRPLRGSSHLVLLLQLHCLIMHVPILQEPICTCVK